MSVWSSELNVYEKVASASADAFAVLKCINRASTAAVCIHAIVPLLRAASLAVASAMAGFDDNWFHNCNDLEQEVDYGGDVEQRCQTGQHRRFFALEEIPIWRFMASITMVFSSTKSDHVKRSSGAVGLRE